LLLIFEYQLNKTPKFVNKNTAPVRRLNLGCDNLAIGSKLELEVSLVHQGSGVHWLCSQIIYSSIENIYS